MIVKNINKGYILFDREDSLFFDAKGGNYQPYSILGVTPFETIELAEIVKAEQLEKFDTNHIICELETMVSIKSIDKNVKFWREMNFS